MRSEIDGEIVPAAFLPVRASGAGDPGRASFWPNQLCVRINGELVQPGGFIDQIDIKPSSTAASTWKLLYCPSSHGPQRRHLSPGLLFSLNGCTKAPAVYSHK